MFTGIIEEIGKIKSMSGSTDSIEMSITAKEILKDVRLGDSIAVNGVCLTVTSYTSEGFTVDVMPETVRTTSLQTLSRNSSVNLERAMSAKGRFGGHFVSGHVDGIGSIVKKDRYQNAIYYEIEVPKVLHKYMIMKGSIAVDGTSLTIFKLTDHTFTISLIPHTLTETILSEKGVGDIVNIECDLLGKYIEQFVVQTKTEDSKKSSLSASFLEEHGFK
ncbi:riboflavin synthase [Fredinandcohnia quinoae]|uniref:Riboflavin synthase n=1 Tax=Fredinandcohnia quinoae TaxID=2918902 RepID=A0AAW5DZQ6_9BACI|nr:riboflavin synthase [Fredinandcohnia sp. SECRCQ15]MCH1624809.1 riboflavin synthase [Fredinandcohnia sp. SECRCQ15]